MKSLFLALNLALLLFSSACQVKESSSTGGLFARHAPATNTFTLQPLSAHTFITGNTILLRVDFPFNVTVTGAPQIGLTIGVTARNAAYVSGTGTTTLTFTYLVVPADNDLDGIQLTGLSLNGGTMTFNGNGVITNCDVSTLAAATFSTTFVDNTAPAPTALALTTLPGFYNKNDTLNFTVTFSETIHVTGTPRLPITLGVGGVKYATYVGGTGSTVLAFSLLIDNTMAEVDQYDAIAALIDLNGGTIKDSVSNDASLSIAAFTAAVRTYSATVLFDGRVPFVVSLTIPPDMTYLSAQSLDFVVEYDRAVVVTGSPYILVTIGANPRQATYLSGTGTNILTFRYTTIPGDIDADGITIAPSMVPNAGTIVGSAAPAMSYFSPVLNNFYTVPSSVGVIVNSVQPQPTSAFRNIDNTLPTWGAAAPDNVWIISQDLLISVAFNTNMYVDQTNGTPRIPITIGVTTKYATYLSGGNGQTTLVFRYVIQANDLDSDGSVALGSIDLNGGNITDVTNTNTLLVIPTAALTSTTIDGVRPTIASVIKPADGVYSTYVNMDFTVNWSEAVNYSSSVWNIPLTIGATPISAGHVSGSNGTAFVHRPNLAGRTDVDGIAMASPMTGTAVIKDLAGNTAAVFTFVPPVTVGLLVDTTVASIDSVTPPPAGTYTLGGTLDFTVTFNEIVTVTSAGGYPRIALALDAPTTRYATYLSGSGSTNIVFRYTVVAGDSDLTGITNPAVVTSTGPGYIRDPGMNFAASYAMTTTLTGVIVDALAPTISSRAAPPNATYDSGDVLTITTTFSETVNVVGIPRIQVTAQTGTLNFDYLSGTGTTTLTFRYTVTANDFDFDGLTNPAAVGLNGGTIKDTALNDATLSFSALPMSSIFLAYPGTEIWSTPAFPTRPGVSGITVTRTAGTQTCGTSICSIFDGSRTLSISAALNNAAEVFIVFQTPNFFANLDMFGTDITLTDNTTSFDLNTANATVNMNGATSSGVNHGVGLALNSLNILHVNFSSSQSYGSGNLMGPVFQGTIGDVIVITSPLTAPKRTQILNYLNAKY